MESQSAELLQQMESLLCSELQNYLSTTVFDTIGNMEKHKVELESKLEEMKLLSLRKTNLLTFNHNVDELKIQCEHLEEDLSSALDKQAQMELQIQFLKQELQEKDILLKEIEEEKLIYLQELDIALQSKKTGVLNSPSQQQSVQHYFLIKKFLFKLNQLKYLKQLNQNYLIELRNEIHEFNKILESLQEDCLLLVKTDTMNSNLDELAIFVKPLMRKRQNLEKKIQTIEQILQETQLELESMYKNEIIQHFIRRQALSVTKPSAYQTVSPNKPAVPQVSSPFLDEMVKQHKKNQRMLSAEKLKHEMTENYNTTPISPNANQASPFSKSITPLPTLTTTTGNTTTYVQKMKKGGFSLYNK